MNPRIVKILAIVLGLAGLFALLTGIGGVEYAFKTGHWSISEYATPAANRIVGALLIVFALFLFRLKPTK
jgi:hypothetical protein